MLRLIYGLIFIFICFFLNDYLYANGSVIEIGRNLNNTLNINYFSNRNLYQNYSSTNSGVSLTYFYNVYEDLYVGLSIVTNNKVQYDYINTYTTDKTTEEDIFSYKISNLGSINFRYLAYNNSKIQISLGVFVSLYKYKFDIINTFNETKLVPQNIVEETRYNVENNEIPIQFSNGDFSMCSAGYYTSPDLNIAVNPVTNQAFIASGYIVCNTNQTVYVDKTFNYEDSKNIVELQYYLGFDITTSYTLYKNVAIGLSLGVTNVNKFSIPSVKYGDLQATFYTNSLYTKAFLSFSF